MVYDIITVGSATLDVFAQTRSKHLKIKHKNHDEELVAYPLGSKVLIDNIDFQIGGGGSNTAVAAARIGLNSAYLGSIGEDLNGKRILELLKEEKVKFIGTTCDTMTNYSVILDTKNGDRTILVYKGASEKFDFSKIDKKELDAKWFYLCAMVGKGYKELEKIASYASTKGIRIAFNPSSYIAKKGYAYLKKIMQMTDVLILNKEEAEMIVGNKGTKIRLAYDLHRLGPKNVVITEGKKKVTVLYGGVLKEFAPKRTRCVEATGAGDAFGSTLISSLIIKDDIDFAISNALKNSQSVIKHTGAKAGLLTKKQLLA